MIYAVIRAGRGGREASVQDENRDLFGFSAHPSSPNTLLPDLSQHPEPSLSKQDCDELE